MTQDMDMARHKAIQANELYTLGVLVWCDFLRDKRSSDLNQPSLVGASDVVCNEVLELFVLFWDGVRFGSGLALGVDKRRRVAISDSYSMQYRNGQGCDANMITKFWLRDYIPKMCDLM